MRPTNSTRGIGRGGADCGRSGSYLLPGEGRTGFLDEEGQQVVLLRPGNRRGRLTGSTPFGVREVVARMRAVLRRTRPSSEEPATQSPPSSYAAGTLVIDRRARRVFLDGSELPLTPRGRTCRCGPTPPRTRSGSGSGATTRRSRLIASTRSTTT